MTKPITEGRWGMGCGRSGSGETDRCKESVIFFTNDNEAVDQGKKVKHVVDSIAGLPGTRRTHISRVGHGAGGGGGGVDQRHVSLSRPCDADGRLQRWTADRMHVPAQR